VCLAQAEIQYVALRNIQLICQKRADILQSEVKVFFCKYNDPIYVKMEKLDVLVMLSSERNIDQVLMEFKEYATEIDDELVCKAVRCIGRCAVKLDCAAERCVQVLVELIQTKVNYVVQEAIIVIRDIFRKYPNKYESVIGTLCENLDTLDDSEAKVILVPTTNISLTAQMLTREWWWWWGAGVDGLGGRRVRGPDRQRGGAARKLS
jgi:AP-1 complex subunit beta-1